MAEDLSTYPFPLSKRIEMAFGKALMTVLRWFVSRRRVLPARYSFEFARVLLLRQNQIGDTLVSTPVFAALKHKHPNMILDVVLDRRNRSVLDGDTNIRHRYILKQKFLDIFSIISRIRKVRYDFIVDLIHTPSTTSTLICLFAKARYTVGFIRDNDFIYDIKIPLQTERGMRMALAEVLRVFGIVPKSEMLQPYYHLTPESVAFAERVTAALRQDESRRDKTVQLVGVNISASAAEKFWGEDNFINLISHLKTHYPQAVAVILCSKDYREAAERIAERSGAVVSEETKTLSDFAAMISKMDFLITPDSAATHFGDIFRVPEVILTNNRAWVKEWYPSFTKFSELHSADDYISSIPFAGVAAAVDAMMAGVLEEGKIKSS
ncbi:MAG: glycosyltransferase family 9 protein [Rhizobacter sp.]|nr:glycosyltransferase family 9 protein [Chlorobiales bacterium]